MAMLRIVLVGTASHRLSREDTESRIKRALKAEVGGVVMTRGPRFLQAIEGPQSAVEATLGRIQADPSFHGIVVMSRTETSERSYPDDPTFIDVANDPEFGDSFDFGGLTAVPVQSALPPSCVTTNVHRIAVALNDQGPARPAA